MAAEPPILPFPKKRGRKPKIPTLAPVSANGMTNLWKLFVMEYIKTPTEPAKAYMRADPKCTDEKQAEKRAKSLLKRRVVSEAIAEVYKKAVSQTKTDAAWVQEIFRQIVLRGLQAVPVLDDEGNPTGTWRCDLPSATRANELLGKLHGLFGGPGGNLPNVNITNVQVNGAAVPNNWEWGLTKEEMAKMPLPLFESLCDYLESVRGEPQKALPAPITVESIPYGLKEQIPEEPKSPETPTEGRCYDE